MILLEGGLLVGHICQIALAVGEYDFMEVVEVVVLTTYIFLALEFTT